MAKNYCPVSTALLALFMRKEEISYLKFHETYVFEQGQHVKTPEKPWIYQELSQKAISRATSSRPKTFKSPSNFMEQCPSG